VKQHAIVISLICSALGLARAQDASDAKSRSTVLALEHAWDQALGSGDVKALASIFDNSLAYVDYDGTLLTKAAYLVRVRSNATHLQQVVSDEIECANVQKYRHRGWNLPSKRHREREAVLETWALCRYLGIKRWKLDMRCCFDDSNSALNAGTWHSECRYFSYNLPKVGNNDVEYVFCFFAVPVGATSAQCSGCEPRRRPASKS
jgi:hypothetical protein